MVKPKDISPPFPKETPLVTIHDNVWYVPVVADLSKFTFPGWETIFPNKAPIHVEYCSGNGSWIAEQAENNPDINWVAVEKRFDRARKLWSKIKNRGLSNLIIAFAEAHTLSKTYFPSASISSIYINFPDPWPKKRHAKHRLISNAFLEEASRVLIKSGSLILVTDDPDYSEQFIELCAHQNFFSPLLKSGYSTPPENYGTSFFDSLFRSQGKIIRYHALENQS